MSFDDRRRFKRVQVDIQMVYGEELELDGTDALMSDLSLGGCSLKTDNAPVVDSLVSFQFKVPETDRVIRARGKVQWVRPPEKGAKGVSGLVGIMFTEISNEDLMELKRYVEKRISEELFI